MSDPPDSPQEPTEAGYDVGYQKPPKHTRFQPGQSGNPRGRPKGAKNLKTDLLEELGERIVVREGDRPRKLSKQRALLKSVVNRAIQGDARATALALSTMMRLLDTGAGAPDLDEDLDAGELAILRAFEARVRQRGDGPAPREDAADSDTESPS